MDHLSCLRSLRPICMITACCGIVLLLAGFVSFIKFGGDEGRTLLVIIGCIVTSFSIIFLIVFKIRVSHPVKSGFMNSRTSRTEREACWTTLHFGNVITELYPDKAQLWPKGCNKVVGSKELTVSLVRPPSRLAFEIEIPPSYEEAISSTQSSNLATS